MLAVSMNSEPYGHVVSLLTWGLQEAGETIFVPSGWHHTVQNLEDTLSINHNWLNGYNIHWALALLQQEHRDATACIEDCRYACVSAGAHGRYDSVQPAK